MADRSRLPGPRLDWPRLDAVRERVPVPLSLHGASGLPDADVRRAVRAQSRAVAAAAEAKLHGYAPAAARSGPIAKPAP